MAKDITITNSCVFNIHTKVLKVFQDKLKDFNALNNCNYSLNDIKEITVRSYGVVIRFSTHDCISFHWDELEDSNN